MLTKGYYTQGILLVGSTGNGKSTLGNFLLDPREEHIFGDKQAFVRAQDNMPQTQFVHHVSKIVSYGEQKFLAATVVDTPGLNENDVQDFKHMIQIVSTLHSINDSEVSACILVVKFDSKIDAQYKATVQYYRDLLPQLFEKNVIIVMTMFDSSSRGERERELRGINIHRIKENTVREIMESGRLPFKPILFIVSGLPLTQEELQTDLQQRDAILSYISSLTPISTGKLRVAKTARLREDDAKTIAVINGEIDGYNNRLKELNGIAGKALDKIKLKRKRVGDLESQLRNLRADLKEYDSSEVVLAKSWSFSTQWRLLQWITESFDVSAPWKITNVEKWTNGYCVWKDLEEYHNGIKGVLEGNFNRGLYAELRLETTKRIKYADEIQSIRAEIVNTDKLLTELTESLSELESSNAEYNNEIKSLTSYTQECNKRKELYEQLYMTIEEACERLRRVYSATTAVCGQY